MAPLPKYLTGDKEGIKKFIDQFDVFLFDCDGVLWSGDHLFEGTVDTLEMLRSKGKQLVFVTNNSTKSRADYKKKLDAMGIPAKVHELTSAHIPHLGGTDPTLLRAITPADHAAIAAGTALDPSVGAVLCGLDFHLNYLKLSLAYHYLRRGAVFLATNTDSSLPSAGALFPGAGAVSAPLVKMVGREPLSLGKPSQAMMDAIEGKFRFERARACMVGDRLDTDIRFGIEGGLGGTLAVLTGVSRKEEWEGEGKPVVPMAYVDKLGDLRG
ncbi:4-nitrophenylphosphatase [Lasallia pustulata]|uniref:4-nitrophenylphosphatase n=1 Tax=Lasallia pustulata TaxID=136370 RepID=A0A1W5CUS2_9LECA|nr:4-nitrophenylphosphatase [Lasallia pustulata]